MPIYEYECDACGRRFEVIQKLADPPVDVCRECGKGPVHRQVSSPAIQFKGSGWYVTDYAQKGKSDKSDSSSTSGGKTNDAKKLDGGGEKKSDGGGDSAPAKSDGGSTTTPSSTGSASKDSKE